MRKSKIERLIGASGAVGLALLLLALVSPLTPADSSAMENPASDTGEPTATEIYVKSMIAITTEKALDFEITPNSDQATFGKSTTHITVTTNNQSGYGLYLHTTSPEGKLRSRDATMTDTINPMAAGVTAMADSAQFASNTWGYSKDNATYQAVPTASTQILTTKTAGTDVAHNINIGAKIDTNLPVGSYYGEVVFSAVANPVTVTTLADLEFMQNITPGICANTTEIGKTYVLKDKRDGKSYNVAKLKDNNCWMQQDLAFDINSTTNPLKPETSDVGASVTLPATSTSSGAISSSSTNIESRHPNNYWYYTWPAATANSSTKATATGTIASDSICPKGWQLPLAGTAIINNVSTNADISPGSFKYLFSIYDVANISQMINIGEQSPLSFARTGFIGTSGLSNVNLEGLRWSRVAATNSEAYGLYWRSEYFRPSDSIARFGGYPVRCLARQVAR